MARLVAGSVAGSLPTRPGAAPEVLELGAFGAGAVASGAEPVPRAEAVVTGADLLVVATPVYKAGYTGLLKLFLDRLGPTSLEGTVAIPVVLSASTAHGAIADLQLRLVLQAVGALLPVPSLVLEEHHLDDLSEYVNAWEGRFGPVIAAVVKALRLEEARPPL